MHMKTACIASNILAVTFLLSAAELQSTLTKCSNDVWKDYMGSQHVALERMNGETSLGL